MKLGLFRVCYFCFCIFLLAACSKDRDIMREGKTSSSKAEGVILKPFVIEGGFDETMGIETRDMARAMIMSETNDGGAHFQIGDLDKDVVYGELKGKTSDRWRICYFLRKPGGSKVYMASSRPIVKMVNGQINLRSVIDISASNLLSLGLDGDLSKWQDSDPNDSEAPQYGEEWYISGLIFNPDLLPVNSLNRRFLGTHFSYLSFRTQDAYVPYLGELPNTEAPVLLSTPWTKVRVADNASKPNAFAKVKFKMRGSLFKVTIDNTHSDAKDLTSTVYIQSRALTAAVAFNPSESSGFPQNDTDIRSPRLDFANNGHIQGLFRQVTVQKGEVKTYYLWGASTDGMHFMKGLPYGGGTPIGLDFKAERDIDAYVQVFLPTSHTHGTVAYVPQGAFMRSIPQEGYVYPITIKMLPFVAKKAPYPLELDAMAEHNVSYPASTNATSMSSDNTTQNFQTREQVSRINIPGYHIPTYADWKTIFDIEGAADTDEFGEKGWSFMWVSRESRYLTDEKTSQDNSYDFVGFTPVSGSVSSDQYTHKYKAIFSKKRSSFTTQRVPESITAIRFYGNGNKKLSAWRYKLREIASKHYLEIKQIYVGPYLAADPEFFEPDEFWQKYDSQVVTRLLPIGQLDKSFLYAVDDSRNEKRLSLKFSDGYVKANYIGLERGKKSDSDQPCAVRLFKNN